jgi:cyclopropane fatty-acyl-phospholipid synthase-like methyltransferase
MSEQPKGPPPGPRDWEATYANGEVEAMPWFHETLDPDVDRALARLGIAGGRFLDLGTGPGTQAIAMAGRGFHVTASDLSPTAVAKASARAARERAEIHFVADDILATQLHGPFDLVLDRGCFHVFSAERRAAYVATVARLVAPGGHLFLKTFSVNQPGTEGPNRFSPDMIRALFGEHFDVQSIDETVYHGTLSPLPIALFTVMTPR